MLLFFCLQLITGLVRLAPTALGLAESVLGSFVVITLTGLLLEVIDQLCVGIVQAAGETTESMGDKITIFAGLAITSAAIVWLSQLVRKTLLLVAIVFTPLALSGASWDATQGVDQQVGHVRGRTDLFQARAGGDVPGSHHPSRRTHRRGPVLDQ